MDFKKLTKPYFVSLEKDLETLVRIASFDDDKTKSKNTPYGKGVDTALKTFSKIGKKHGFKVELNKRYVELSLGSKGKLIEVFGHLDVVPSSKDIYHLKKDKNNYYGRGVADDKGPLLASLYSIIALKDAHLLNNVRVKVFAGGAEEIGGSCLEAYTKNHPAPDFGFTPDSKFPVVYGEKGIGNLIIKKKINLSPIKSISGGNAGNTVIGECTFILNNNKKVIVKGIPAHGSTPSEGKNAFLIGLKKYGNKDGKALADLFLDYSGKKLNAYNKTKAMGETVYNVGIVNYKNNELTLHINFRYPEKPTPKSLIKNILKTLGAKSISEDYVAPLLFDLKSPLVKNLLNAYVKETNDKKSKPIVLGGGTYAKEVKNTVAFGIEPSNKEYNMHCDNEYIPIKVIKDAMSIYAHAIYNLSKIK